MKSNKKGFLKTKQLCKYIAKSSLKFKTTDELKPLTKFLGQTRAVHALLFGIRIQAEGYNLFAMGPSGIGKRSLIKKILEKEAPLKNTPKDWCYVHNFVNPSKPSAMAIPPGTALKLQCDMRNLMQEIARVLLNIYESEEYNVRLQSLHKKINLRFKKNKLPRYYRELLQQEKELEKEIVHPSIKRLFLKIKTQYETLTNVVDFLNAAENELLQHLKNFIHKDEKSEMYFCDEENPIFKVNAFVNNTEAQGAPIIFEDNPCYNNLICRLEHITQNGVLTTNFTLLKPGALHKANGGYLVIEAKNIKKNHNAWEALKRILASGFINIDPVENTDDHPSLITLDPEPIPISIKIILIGERREYYSLVNKEKDFNELFRVTVDFDDQIPRTDENINLYARLIATIIQRKKLKPFDQEATAAILEYSSRIAEDAEKLSTHFGYLENMLVEANFWADSISAKIVTKTHVLKAMRENIFRSDRSRELYLEDIYRKFIIINARGSRVGQVNALSVVRVGRYSYGHPSRITAIARRGRGKIIDVQREAKMVGQIYSKGSIIIANFLAGRYNLTERLNLYASICFEQIYGRIDGDSASIAEVAALLSSLTNIPIYQYLAVTGSMDQYGEAQAIGGVNDKIEGFFKTCLLAGLTGKQGVLIPETNVKNLMLDDEVVLAAKQKKFFIYAYATLDEAIKLLTGIPAGIRIRGKYPKGSVNEAVERRLREFTKS
jgi:lon-related putative ATP-dependent protease